MCVCMCMCEGGLQLMERVELSMSEGSIDTFVFVYSGPCVQYVSLSGLEQEHF